MTIVPVALPSPLAVTCDAPDGLSLEMSIGSLIRAEKFDLNLSHGVHPVVFTVLSLCHNEFTIYVCEHIQHNTITDK